MNLRRHLNVLLRFKPIIISGCLLGIALGVMALFEVRTTGLTWRAQETCSKTRRRVSDSSSCARPRTGTC